MYMTVDNITVIGFYTEISEIDGLKRHTFSKQKSMMKL